MPRAKSLKSGRGGGGGRQPKGHNIDDIVIKAQDIAELSSDGGGREGRMPVMRERGDGKECVAAAVD